jgi:hypothetical protein
MNGNITNVKKKKKRELHLFLNVIFFTLYVYIEVWLVNLKLLSNFFTDVNTFCA